MMRSLEKNRETQVFGSYVFTNHQDSIPKSNTNQKQKDKIPDDQVVQSDYDAKNVKLS